MIRVHDLSGGYGKKEILRHLSLHLPAGEISLLLGPNGSGKTTLLKTLAGLLPLTAGDVLLAGQPLGTYSRRKLAATVAFMPQTRPTPALTVAQLLAVARYPHTGFAGVTSAADRAAIHRAVTLTKTEPLLQRSLATLSGGERQRVYLAMAVAQGAAVLFLDEPTAHMDAAAAFKTAQLLQTLRAEGFTVVAAMHDLPLALSLADRVVLLQNGQAAFEGTPAAARESGALTRVFGVRVEPHGESYTVLPL